MVNYEQLEVHKARITIEYIAGFFDGEGSITVTKDLSLQVVISQTDETVLLAIAQYFGAGTVRGYKPRRGHKICYTLRWCGQKARAVLEKLVPHLILKKDRAALGIKLASLATGGRHEIPTPQNIAEREQLTSEIKRLNDSHWSRRATATTRGVN